MVCAALGLGLAGGFPAVAQEADEPVENNDAAAAEVLARISELMQSTDLDQPEDQAPATTNRLPQTINPAQDGTRVGRSDHSNATNRSQPDDRRSRGRRSSRSSSDPSRSSSSAPDRSGSEARLPVESLTGTKGGSAGLDYASFKVIVDRNIFDPNRYPRRPGEPRVRSAPRTVDSLTLVGTMSYDKGTFAFFDGSQSDYRKALKLTDAIAGYKVTNIAPDSVTLAAGTNALELHVGMQLRREEDGPWRLGGRSVSPEASPASTSTNAVAAAPAAEASAASAGTEAASEIIKRLMQRREQE